MTSSSVLLGQILLFAGIICVEGKIDYSVAEGLLQIQRVLELSTEIANAEDASTMDNTPGESQYAETYVLPDSFQFGVLNNNVNSEVNIRSREEERLLLSDGALMEEADPEIKNEILKYSSMDLKPQYTSSSIYQRNQNINEDSFTIPVAHSYVSAYVGGSSNHPPNHELRAQEHIYDIKQPLREPQHTAPEGFRQRQIFDENSQHSNAYTQAIIRPSPTTGNFPVAELSDDYMTVAKMPIAINFRTHPHFDMIRNHDNVEPSLQQYIPLQILINQLAEHVDLSGPVATTGREQPKVPIYHYSPVPFGVIKNEHVPEMRIKSGITTLPNPHSVVHKEPFHQSSTELPDQYDDGDDDDKYDFGYRVTDEDRLLEFGKTETKKNGVTIGNYHVLLPDGRLQVVNYWSDHTGYHTNISYSAPSLYV